MTKKLLFIITLFTITGLLVLCFVKSSHKEKYYKVPDEWLYKQRAYPYKNIDSKAIFAVRNQALAFQNNQQKDLTAPWTMAGPVNIGGRITDIEISPSDTNTFYIGTASGGIFKTLDHGQNWVPIFDNEVSISIGALAIDPTNSDVIYAGSGEANASSNNGAFPGNGIYKSTNGGSTWTNIGLPNSENIGRIVINPTNTNIIYTAAMGRLYGTNPERGVYRSINSGSTWQKVLFVNDSTGCIDIVINPTNPNIVYAAMWERVKYPFGSMRCGAGSGVYKSVDGGDTWLQLTNGLPTSDINTGRIGITLSKTNPNILYAIYSIYTYGNFNGVYKTTNGGTSWTRTDVGLGDINNGYGWYFGNIRVDPNNANIVYALGMDLWKSTNGGINWNNISSWVHVDHHALLINPSNSNSIVSGNDGGLYFSGDAGNNWNFVPTLPVTQFYCCEIDNLNPLSIYGGAQDNSTMRTMTGNTNDWEIIYGGDGFYVVVDPTDNNNIYCEYQYGQLSYSNDGGYSFYNGMNGINPGDRMNWNTPFVMDPNDNTVLYYGSNYLYKSSDMAHSWTPISGDLTNNNGDYTSITTIAVAPSNSNVIYVGTDDANAWVTQNGGTSWTNISASLPNRYITRVTVAPDSAEVVYITFSGYKYNEYLPHIYRSTNYGQTWQDISGNLPQGPINDIIVDPLNSSFLYIATDVGVYVTSDLGANWLALGTGIPIVPVFDLTIHNPSRTLLAATYGRSMYKYDLGYFASINNNSANIFSFKAYPNPFTEQIVFQIENRTQNITTNLENKMVLQIYDISGKLIKTINSEKNNKIIWNGNNNAGEKVKAGIYICKTQFDGNNYYSKIIYSK